MSSDCRAAIASLLDSMLVRHASRVTCVSNTSAARQERVSSAPAATPNMERKTKKIDRRAEEADCRTEMFFDLLMIETL